MTIEEKLFLQYQIEQFYYHEALLLDQRKFQQWLGLCDEAIEYIMPARFNPQREGELRDVEAFLSVEHEVQSGGSAELPQRDENYFVLALRVNRAFKPNAWGENPPPSTVRQVSNVQCELLEGGSVSVNSNFLLSYTRWGQQAVIYSGHRFDTLIREGGSAADFKIRRREVLLSDTVVQKPTTGLFF